MSRADRWWRPTSRRPAVRARSRMYRYNEYDVNLAYDRGIMRGAGDTVERHQRGEQLNADFDLVEQAHLRDPERFRQLAEAIELGGEAGKEAVERLAREWGVFPESDGEQERRWWSDDDVTDLAQEVGVLDAGDGIVVEIERWLRERGRGE